MEPEPIPNCPILKSAHPVSFFAFLGTPPNAGRHESDTLTLLPILPSLQSSFAPFRSRGPIAPYFILIRGVSLLRSHNGDGRVSDAANRSGGCRGNSRQNAGEWERTRDEAAPTTTTTESSLAPPSASSICTWLHNPLWK